MKILITGCSGYVGRAALDHLQAHGHEIRAIDLTDPEIPGIDFRTADLMEAQSLNEHCTGVDAILHLAGIPGPALPATDLFALNCAGTFNVYNAAANTGVSRVVVASSIHAMGFFFGPKPFELSQLPVQEDHPKFTTDSYSFSKQITEEVGDYFWRRDGITSASLRFGAGWHNPQLSREDEIAAYVAAKERAKYLATLPPDTSAALIEKAQTTFDQLRGDRAFEGKTSYVKALSDPDLKLMWMKHTFFSYVDLADACQAMERGLTANFTGSHPLFVVHANNILNQDAVQLARLFYPALVDRAVLSGAQSFLSGQRAAKMLGFNATTHPDQLLNP
jgi:NAD(P)-dependent dehydrogenase (short-subunit alcohol dehydrogenase family)